MYEFRKFNEYNKGNIWIDSVLHRAGFSLGSAIRQFLWRCKNNKKIKKI